MIAKIVTSGLIMRDDGRFLIVKRSQDDTFMPGLWELPGGKTDEMEYPEDGTIRELKEETGIDVDVLYPFHVEAYMSEKQTFFTEIFYLCHMKNQNQEVKLSFEHSDFQWVTYYSLPLEDVEEYFKRIISTAQSVLKDRA